MVLFNYVVRVVFAQFEQSSLANFEELVDGFVLDRFVGQGVDEDEGDENHPEKAECVGLEVGDERKAKHFQEGLIFGLDVFVEERGAERRHIPVNLCFEIFHSQLYIFITKPLGNTTFISK